MYDLRHHLDGIPAPPAPVADGATLGQLRRDLARGLRGGEADESGARRLEQAARLGLFDLGALVSPAAERGDAHEALRACADPLYGELLSAVAEHDFELARLVAAHHTAALFGGFASRAARRCYCPVTPLGRANGAAVTLVDVPPAWIECGLLRDGARWSWVTGAELELLGRPLAGWEPLSMLRVDGRAPETAPVAPLAHDVPLGLKQSLDFVALLCGRLRAGQEIARAFTSQRVLFRRVLGDNPYIRTWQADHAERLAALEAVRGLLGQALARGRTHPDLALLGYYAASRGLALAADLMQMCGGTGYMRESRMPDVYLSVVALIEVYRPESGLTDDDLAAALGGPEGAPRARAQARPGGAAQAAGQVNLRRREAFGIRAAERRGLDDALDGFARSLVPRGEA